VVNHDCGYLHRIDDCRFVDGIFDMAAAFAERGFAVVIATNQSGIGRGYYGEAEFEALMGWMGGSSPRTALPSRPFITAPTIRPKASGRTAAITHGGSRSPA
jgi:hypothetical protein